MKNLSPQLAANPSPKLLDQAGGVLRAKHYTLYRKAVSREAKPFDLLDAIYELTGLDLSNCGIGEIRIVKDMEPVYQPP